MRRVSVGELSILSALRVDRRVVLHRRAATRRRRAGAGRAGAERAADPSPAPSANAPLPAATCCRTRVAVLPCENQSPDPNDAYFASGLHQDIIWQLDKLQELDCRFRDVTVLRYADTELSISEIAAELSVRALLDCTIRYADNRVRITAELVDSTGLQTLWQGRLRAEPRRHRGRLRGAGRHRDEHRERTLRRVHSRRARVARETADRVDGSLRPVPAERTRSPTTTRRSSSSSRPSQPTQSSRPRERRWRSCGPRSSSTPTISAAIAADARAEHQAKVREYAERALALDPTIPFARSALTLTAMLNWQWTEAYERLVRRARPARRTTSRSTTSSCCRTSAGTKKPWTSCSAASSSIRTTR